MDFHDYAHLKKIDIQYKGITNLIICDNYFKSLYTDNLVQKRSSLFNFKNLDWTLFSPHSEGGLAILCFSFVHPDVDDLKRFRTVLVLNASSYNNLT